MATINLKLKAERRKPTIEVETDISVRSVLIDTGAHIPIRFSRQEGRKEGENLLAALMNKLLSLGRNDDALKAANDPAFRDSLYIQFGLKKLS